MLDLNKLREGEKLSMTEYFTVEQIMPQDGAILARNSAGSLINISGKEMIESRFNSNSQYNEEIKAGKNEMAGKLQTAGDKVFTVCFEKQDGSERILTGHLVSAEPNLGRTKVIDLNVGADDKSKGIRQVDNRTIKWLVIDNQKLSAQ